MSKGLFLNENDNPTNTANSLLALWGRNLQCQIVKTTGITNFVNGTLAIYLLNDCNFSAFTSPAEAALTNINQLAGVDLPAGLFIPLDATQIILTSGVYYVFTKNQI